MTATEWAHAAPESEVTLDGLARLEREAMADAPDVLARIDAAIAGAFPRLEAVEREHEGRTLMLRVNARVRESEQRAVARGFLGSFLGFLMVLFPTIWLGMMVRGDFELSDFIGWTVGLGIAAAVIAVVLFVLYRRDPGGLGAPVGWSGGAAVVAVLAVVFTSVRVAADFERGGPAGDALQIAGAVSAFVLVAFALENLRRSTVHRRRTRELFGADDAAAETYLARIASEYQAAIARIDDATSTLTQRQRNDMKDDRDNAFAIWKSRGWVRGQVPPVISPKVLGELQLMAVTEPLVGGGEHYQVFDPSRPR